MHDCAVLSDPKEVTNDMLSEHDVPVDWILTPTQVIKVSKAEQKPKPEGIYWDLLTKEKLDQVPVLKEIRRHMLQFGLMSPAE